MRIKRLLHQEKSYQQWCQDDPTGMKMLDRALEGASTQEKARVRNVLLSFDIEPDHEFYIIFVAIGQLLVLVKEAPENWRALFDDVHKELKLWSKENFKSLESIKLHAETSAELIVVLRQLLDLMRSSQTSSHETSTTLHSLKLALSSIESKLEWLQTWHKVSRSKLTSIESQLSHSQTQRSQIAKQITSQIESRSSDSHRQLNQITQEITAWGSEAQSQLNQIAHRLDASERQSQRREWILNASLGAMGLAVATLFFNNQALGRQLKNQGMLVQTQREEIGWLLRKASRAECYQGIQPPDHSQCRQYDL